MANVITITEADTQVSIQEKIRRLLTAEQSQVPGFDAKKFTGKIKSYGDALAYQRNLRDEWR